MIDKYHFSLHLQFKDDCDVDKIEKELGVTAYRKNLLKDSVGQNKTAKLWFKTEDFNLPDVFSVLDKFIQNFEPKFKQINNFNNKYNGKTTFTLYFEDCKIKPFIKLSPVAMRILSENKITFEVDFRV